VWCIANPPLQSHLGLSTFIYFLFTYVFIFVVLGIKPRASRLVGKHSTNDLCFPILFIYSLIIIIIIFTVLGFNSRPFTCYTGALPLQPHPQPAFYFEFQDRLAFTYWSSCLCLLNAGITSMNHHGSPPPPSVLYCLTSVVRDEHFILKEEMGIYAFMNQPGFESWLCPCCCGMPLL
jgi:hypothetical protein